MPLHSPAAVRLAASAAVQAGEEPRAVTAAVAPLIEHILKDGMVETDKQARAWEMYDSPEVRFACRQYSNAFSGAKLVLGRRKVLWEDPEPIDEPGSKEEEKAFQLLQSFCGGFQYQVELLDRIGTYFIVTGDMAMVGAYDPQRMAESKWARWDVWSTTEIRWNGSWITIRENAIEDVWQQLPDYIKHFRMWNRHPRRGWESDSPVMSALKVLELVGLYDDRLCAEAVSRLVGGGVWFVPQGLNLPTLQGGSSGSTGDFLELLKQIASISIQNRRSAAATLPIMIEAAAEDIEAASKGLMDFSNDFADRIGELQEAGIRRWAAGVDLPAENMLGLSQATHWNASLITEDKLQSFIIPSLRRGVGNMTIGWLRPALGQFAMRDDTLEMWFDPSGIKTRVELADEAQWAYEHHLLGDADTNYALGLSQMKSPTPEELKRRVLLEAAAKDPTLAAAVLKELGISVSPELEKAFADGAASPKITVRGGSDAAPPNGDGRSGPQAANAGDRGPGTTGPGRTARLSTQRS